MENGHPVLFIPVARLVERLLEAKRDLRLARELKQNFPLAHPSFPPVRTLWRTPLERSEGAFLRKRLTGRSP